MYYFLDVFFTVFHTLLIIFNLCGWIYSKTRKLNLITLLLTGGSWFLLGISYGIGYCPLTDWHFKVLEKLGYHDLPSSYIRFLAKKLSGIDFNATIIEILTGCLFFLALVLSVYFNFFKKKKSV